MAERENPVRRYVAIFAALTVVAVTACASAEAKTVQVGSPLTASFFPVLLGQVCNSCSIGTATTTVQRTLPEPANATSPVDGTVISYRVAEADGTFAAQVVRLHGPYSPSYTQSISYRGIGSSAPAPIISSGVSSPSKPPGCRSRSEVISTRS